MQYLKGALYNLQRVDGVQGDLGGVISAPNRASGASGKDEGCAIQSPNGLREHWGELRDALYDIQRRLGACYILMPSCYHEDTRKYCEIRRRTID